MRIALLSICTRTYSSASAALPAAAIPLRPSYDVTYMHTCQQVLNVELQGVPTSITCLEELCGERGMEEDGWGPQC